MSKIIAVANQKGGVAKTTTSISLASSLVSLGKRVLLIDLDPQGNASRGVGLDIALLSKTIFDVLSKNNDINRLIKRTVMKNLDIVPANLKLASFDSALLGKEATTFLLKNAIQTLKKEYDYIIIDCPPSLGLLNTNALTAADSILIPVQCEYYALEGVTQLLITIRLVQRTSNRNLKIEGILLTMFDIRTRLSVEVSQDVRQTFGKLVYQNSIPRNVKLSEAPSRGMSIFEYDPKSTGAKAYAGLTEEVLKRNSKEA